MTRPSPMSMPAPQAALRVSVLRCGYELAVSLEKMPPIVDELLHGHGRAVADDLDEVVRAPEDAVLVVDGNVAQMLDQVRGHPHRGHAVGELLDADGLVPHRDSERAGGSCGD